VTLTWILSGELHLQVFTFAHSPGSNPVIGISCGSCECPLLAHLRPLGFQHFRLLPQGPYTAILTWILSGEFLACARRWPILSSVGRHLPQGYTAILTWTPGSNPVSSCLEFRGSCECPLLLHTFVPWVFDASHYCHGSCFAISCGSCECPPLAHIFVSSVSFILQYSPGYYPVSSCAATLAWILSGELLFWSAIAYFFDRNNPLVCKPLLLLLSQQS
jgi:hypothetical protein